MANEEAVAQAVGEAASLEDTNASGPQVMTVFDWVQMVDDAEKDAQRLCQ